MHFVYKKLQLFDARSDQFRNSLRKDTNNVPRFGRKHARHDNRVKVADRREGPGMRRSENSDSRCLGKSALESFWCRVVPKRRFWEVYGALWAIVGDSLE